MRDDTHFDLPKDELAQMDQDLQDEADANNLDITITTTPVDAQGRVNVTWKVSPKTAAGAALVAAAGAAVAVAAAPVLAVAGVAAGALAGAAGGLLAAFVLGKVSEKFESRGPGDVSGGQGDPGGVSYGSWQMTSQPNGGTVQRFVNETGFPFAPIFKALTPGTKPFSDAWRSLAASQADQFKKVQHDFIKRTHFNPAVATLKASTGLDCSTRSHALQDTIWSTAVQHGPASSIPSDVCRTVIKTVATSTGTVFDAAFIKAIYAERGREEPNGKLVHFPSSGANIVPGLKARFVEEAADALANLNKG